MGQQHKLFESIIYSDSNDRLYLDYQCSEWALSELVEFMDEIKKYNRLCSDDYSIKWQWVFMQDTRFIGVLTSSYSLDQSAQLGAIANILSEDLNADNKASEEYRPVEVYRRMEMVGIKRPGGTGL